MLDAGDASESFSTVNTYFSSLSIFPVFDSFPETVSFARTGSGGLPFYSKWITGFARFTKKELSLPFAASVFVTVLSYFNASVRNS